MTAIQPPSSPICSYTFSTQEIVDRDDTWPYRDDPIESEPLLWSDRMCPYCLAPTRTSELARLGLGYERLTLCDACGWWGIRRVFVGGQDNSQIKLTRGEARHYSVESLEVPLDSLRTYLTKHPNNIAFVNPTRFEQLMADCLRSEYAPCEVLHVGGTADGGVDLKLITSDKEIFLIQVKRRSDLSKREGVSVVRSLNGVLFREGMAKGMVITSASGFTRAAIRETNIRTKTEIPYEVRLLSFSNIIPMLGLPRVKPYEPWREFSELLTRVTLKNA